MCCHFLHPPHSVITAELTLNVLKTCQVDVNPRVSASLLCLLCKRWRDWSRGWNERVYRWVFPAAILLLGGYVESLLLGEDSSFKNTLVYDVQAIFRQPVGFCGAVPDSALKVY